jgi:hypothetical protein
VLVPDSTRSCPLPLLLSSVHGALHGRVSRLAFLVAPGTHAAMTEPALAAHMGYAPGASADRRSSARGRRLLGRQQVPLPGSRRPRGHRRLDWLGALITSAQIIGTRGITPGRALINEAAALVPGERLALCVVTQRAPASCTRWPSATR